MNAWIPALQLTALSLSVLWLLLALGSGTRSPLRIVWALFCLSIAMLMARSLVGAASDWYALFGLGACFTCNGFWLVARALFREGRAFGAPHLTYVAVVAALIIITQQKAIAPTSLILVSGELLELLSSAALVMAFWEGLRGWREHNGVERGMRSLFLLTYGGCVAVTSAAPALLDVTSVQWVNAAAAATILLVTQGLVTWRLRHPLRTKSTALEMPVPSPLQTEACAPAQRQVFEEAAEIRAEDAALARTLEHYMRSERPYLRTDLKLSHLAQALDIGEYRISRAVHGPLGQRNISQYINGYRLQHARELLADPQTQHWSVLVIGLESGFGSLGAFHRAFKAAEDCTPGEYRAGRQIRVAKHSSRDSCSEIGASA